MARSRAGRQQLTPADFRPARRAEVRSRDHASAGQGSARRAAAALPSLGTSGHRGAEGPGQRRRLEDLAYTLCVLTGHAPRVRRSSRPSCISGCPGRTDRPDPWPTRPCRCWAERVRGARMVT
ncbi:DUF5133 domain-containing protein [Streptomyces sp. NPDC005283]|uniref:DUF5133 domain-containing protein n=1 Tax=Streptomyces sp. NPDC005283 TaxID=3156871 RepID=UPI00345205D6